MSFIWLKIELFQKQSAQIPMTQQNLKFLISNEKLTYDDLSARLKTWKEMIFELRQEIEVLSEEIYNSKRNAKELSLQIKTL